MEAFPYFSWLSDGVLVIDLEGLYYGPEGRRFWI